MKFSLFIITLLAITLAGAQDIPSNLSTYGSEFFVGFYEHVHTANTHIFYIHTKSTTSVSYSVTSLDGSFTSTGTTVQNSPSSVSIPYSYEVRDRGYTWRKKGLRISTLPSESISVIAWSYRSSADYMSYMALPCHEQPTNEYTYFVVSTLGWSDQMSQFLIVGCIDNTNITIIPNNHITVPSDPQVSGSSNIVISAYDTFNFTLHSMETFFVFQPYVDLTGSKIISNRPITILSGHEASRVPAGINDADPIVTQLTPTITWGTTFLLAPHAGRTNGQSYKLIASDNDTIANRTCGLVGGTTTNITFDGNNTNWFYTTTGMYCTVQANKPIYVASIGVSTNYLSGSYGDPALFTIPSVDQFDYESQITSFTQATGYYSVVMLNDQYYTGQLKINGATQNISFIPIFNSTGHIYGYGYTSATSGTNTIQHSSQYGGLFVAAYGWTTYGGYGYAGSMRLNPINTQASPPEISFTASEYTVNEGEGVVYVYLEVQNEFADNLTVRVYTNPTPVDTAISPDDYSSFSIDVMFMAGEDTIINVSIPIIDDMYTEPTQYFTISLLSLEEEGEVVFPITDAVVKIIDNDAIQIGLTNDWFLIGDDNLTSVGVSITDGQLEPGVAVHFNLRVLTDNENSTNISCELTSFNPTTIFGIDLNDLSSYNSSSMTQSISTDLNIDGNEPFDVTVGRTTADVVPVVPFMSSSMVPFSSMMPISSSDVMMYFSSSMILCDNIMMSSSMDMSTSSSVSMISSSVIIPTSTTTVFSTITSTVTTSSISTVCPSITPPVFSTPTIISTATVTETSISTTTSISIYVTTATSISTITNSCTDINKNSTVTATVGGGDRGGDGNKNALSQEVEVVGGALYFGIAGFIIAIIGILIFASCFCICCYQRGLKKGRLEEIKFDRDVEMSANNPIYDGISDGDSISYRSSVDEKKLLQYMQ